MRRTGAAMHRARSRAHPLRAFRLAVPPVPQSATHPPRRLTGTGYIRLEIKSAIVSPLNELSHAYAYSRSSSTRSGVRVLGPSARCTARYLSRARARSHAHTCAYARTHTCTRMVQVDARNTSASVCVRVRRCVRSRARRSRFQEVQGSIGVRPVDPGTYSPHPHTDA